MKDILYRTESAYGSGVRNITHVICYEVFSLGNTDILRYLLDHYCNCFDTVLQQEMTNICSDIEECTAFFVDNLGDEHLAIVNQVVKSINTYYDVDLKYCLWLADKSVVQRLYDGCDEDIEAYHTSQYILSNLGEDGVLFAYEENPTPVALGGIS